MVTYPELTVQQQAHLPVLIKPAIALTSQFEDSTHKLWRCETQEGALILKVCNHDSIQQSPFWQGMNSLFSANFPRSLRNIATTFSKIANSTSIAIPNYMAAEGDSYVLAEWLEGDVVQTEDVSNTMVVQLAEHLGKLHSHTQINWGPLHDAHLLAEQWSSRLCESIQELAENHPSMIPNDVLALNLQQAKVIKVDQFVPVMPDLRWDQFLQQNKQLTALVDLDAFVYGPKELELVLLEYLLNAEQAELFKKYYQHHSDLPDLDLVRGPYRLLLFLMNILGETDIKNWLAEDIIW